MMLFIATLLVYLAGIVMGLAIHSHMDDLQTPAPAHTILLFAIAGLLAFIAVAATSGRL